jgi:hypothetical protein
MFSVTLIEPLDETTISASNFSMRSSFVVNEGETAAKRKSSSPAGIIEQSDNLRRLMIGGARALTLWAR